MNIESIITPLIGGVLIGLGSLLAMVGSGKIPGISGIVGRLIRPNPGDVMWRGVFLLGLVVGAAILFQVAPQFREFLLPGNRGTWVIVLAGLLVGFGTRLGGGCTSGHGVCGIGAGARDAIIYTLMFIFTGAVTVLAWNLLMGGAK